VDGRIISIPKEYDELEFLKEYLLKYYPNEKLTILSVAKEEQTLKEEGKTSIEFSSSEKICLWLSIGWNLILYAIGKIFYKKSNSEKSEDDSEIYLDEDGVVRNNNDKLLYIIP
jgi:hypothetical protein